MFDGVQLLALASSFLMLLLVLELVRRHLLGEEYALLWILGAVGLLFLAAWRQGLDNIARSLGVRSGPSLLLLLLALFVFVALLFFSVVISRQRVQIERLIEDQAILEARVRALTRPGPSASRAWPADPLSGGELAQTPDPAESSQRGADVAGTGQVDPQADHAGPSGGRPE